MSENYYKILGVEPNSTKEDIKKAYRKLQMKYHPDKNSGLPDADIITRQINEAYETLGDEHKRKEYDFMQSNPNPFTRMNSFHGPMGATDIDNIISMMFGGGAANLFNMNQMNGMEQMDGMPRFRVFHHNGGPMGFQQAMQKPPPIIQKVIITMEQVLNGSTVPMDIERWIVENGNKVFEHETIYVTVPKGVDDGEIIILRDKGNVLSESIKGDVKVFVTINNDTAFKRNGLDLIFEKHISLKDSLCGFSFEIKYINNKSYTLNNNKGNIIPPEYRKIYPNMGLEREGHKGNMIIHFHLDFPESLTEEQISKLSEIL
jgi:DnaJ-class molecular chaperone